MVPYDVLTDVIYHLQKDMHYSLSDFDKSPWWFIEYIINKHNKFVEEQNEAQEKDNDMFAEQQANMESMYNKQQQTMSSYSNNIGNDFNMPSSLSMPSMPSLDF